MFISQLLLDPASRQVQAEIANRYELHRTLTAQFPAERRMDIGLLYRIELPESQVYQPIRLLIQTQIEPDWREIDRSGFVIETPQIKEFVTDFKVGEHYYFRLLANPSVRRAHPDGKSKRVGLYKLEEQEDWISRKGDQGGFSVEVLEIRNLGMIESIKRKDQRIYQIQHLGVQFDGVLKVSHEETFSNTLIQGLGSAKAFGFGLLSLARPTV